MSKNKHYNIIFWKIADLKEGYEDMDLICEKVIRKMADIEGYITANSLADLTAISASNIKHNLSKIKKEVAKFGVTLQSIPKKGFLLVATVEQRNEIIRALNEEVSKTSEFYTYRKAYILETLFLYPAHYTIQLFGDELSVSRNAIQKDLEQIDKDLKKFHVKIKRVRNQGLILEGEEFNIRQSMIECNNSKYWNWVKDIILDDTKGMDRRISKKAYTYLVHTYDKVILEKIQKELWLLEQTLGIEFVDISFGRLMEYLAITMERVNIGNKIIKNNHLEETAFIDQRYIDVATNILNQLLPVNKKGYLSEAQYLAARLFVASTCNDETAKPNKEYFEIVVDYLLRMEEIIGIKVLSINEILIKELSIAFTRVKIRETYQILDWSELYLDIQKKFSGLYGVCMTNLNEVEQSIACRFRQDDVAWIVLLIYNCLNDASNRISAILVHATNFHTSHYQKGKLEDTIPNIFIKACIYFKDFTPDMGKDTLIIATVPFQDRAENVIEITKHLSEKDMGCIQNEIDGMVWNYQGKMLQEIITEVFDENLIIPDLSVPTKEEAIIRMSKLLEAEGSVEKGFCEKILEREKFCPTSIGNEIAIPHHYQDYINRNRIVVARVRHRIRWNQEEKVKLIFLIAIKYKEPLKINVLFHYLYELIENHEILQKMKQAETKKQIYEFIMQ